MIRVRDPFGRSQVEECDNTMLAEVRKAENRGVASDSC